MSDSNALGSVYEYSGDLATAEAPPPLPEGEYRAQVQACEMRISKQSGRKMMVPTYIVPPDQYPADFTEGNPDGEKFEAYFVLDDTARGRFRMRRLCEMHGVTPKRTLNLTDFIGQEVVVKCEHEEYQGETRARVNPIRQV